MMKFTPTAVSGIFIVELEPKFDHRGFFARSWCHAEFEEHGLNPRIQQCNTSFTIKKGTIRGIHFQLKPHKEAKLVRCITGRIFDVAVDLRLESPTLRKSVGVELSAENRKMLYVPEGCGHGFQTLDNDCEVFYQVSADYNQTSERGVRWNDPAFAISWPIEDPTISERDGSFPYFQIS
jgi:dTDP-4-dehydrorhamnose 3,5-epimerase